jgi:D-glycero-D-manno-heptose 1,7-bisphosphate phosphatase
VSRRRFVLLDRDGTLIRERHYLSRPDQVELLPDAAEGLRRLRELGLGLAVVTNQSAVGRKYMNARQLEEVHDRLRKLLQGEGIELDGLYVCPHTPEDGCACRKPARGLADQAAREHGFEPGECFVVGDKECDIDLGLNLGATTILVRTGYGAELEAKGVCRPDAIVDDLVAAAEWIGTMLRA